MNSESKAPPLIKNTCAWQGWGLVGQGEVFQGGDSEDQELTLPHGHTNSTAIYGTIFFKKELKIS